LDHLSELLLGEKEWKMSEECIFCDPKADALIFRDADGIVIIDDPIRTGHVLVGSRTHAESFHDISSEDAAALMRLANRVARSVVEITGASKVYVAAIGDKDKHFHVHLLPKFPNDPNLGPFIFGANGWASLLKPISDPAQQPIFNATLKIKLQP
jgi:diadenosine tetraphosphate (Ap4A) HIT family hydrolase